MSVTTLNFYENREYGGITFRYYRFDLGARMIITARYSVADDMSLSRAGFDITTGRGAIFDTDMSEDDSEEIFGYIDSEIGRIRAAVGSYEEANEAAAGENGISPPPDGASVKVSFDFSLLKRLLGL